MTTGGQGLVAVGTTDNESARILGYQGKEPTHAVVWTSEDGRTWTRLPDDPVRDAMSANAVTAGGPGVVAVGDNEAWFSSDGITWDQAAVPPVPADVYLGDDGRHPQIYLTDVAASEWPLGRHRHGAAEGGRPSALERLIYQPDEVPTEPMAMPAGMSSSQLEKGGGYLPSLAGSTSDGPGAAMASDAPSLARWWRAFCAGEIVSQASLTEMATFVDPGGYGLGLFSVADPYYLHAVGHTGSHIGYKSWAGCLPDAGSVVVVLTNQVVEDIGGMARPLVLAADSDVHE